MNDFITTYVTLNSFQGEANNKFRRAIVFAWFTTQVVLCTPFVCSSYQTGILATLLWKMPRVFPEDGLNIWLILKPDIIVL